MYGLQENGFVVDTRWTASVYDLQAVGCVAMRLGQRCVLHKWDLRNSSPTGRQAGRPKSQVDICLLGQLIGAIDHSRAAVRVVPVEYDHGS
jgi:hypothetical protein